METAEALILVILPLFVKNQATESEIAAFVTAIFPFLGPNAPKSGTIPAFRVAGETFGPIPFAPAS